LLAEGDKHAWLFVLNQWDKGLSEQYEDFKQQLYKAGLAEPIIYKTACAEGLQADEFAALESTIASLATEHTVKQLEYRSARIRYDALKQRLEHIIKLLGPAEAFPQLQGLWQAHWRHTATVLQQGFAWPIRQMAHHLAAHAADIGNPSAQEPKQATYGGKFTIWDDWAEARFDDILDDCISNADQLGIPMTPVKKQFSGLREKAPKMIQSQSELAARQALANPGNALQRAFLTFMRLCEIILPLAAIAWVGFKVFIGYYASTLSNADYLGVDFAVHSGLLIAITWLTPFFMLKKLTPSVEKSVLTGLNKGLANAIDRIDDEVSLVINNISGQHTEQIKGLTDIIEHCDMLDGRLHSSIDNKSPLVRMLKPRAF
jgi:hypothetical protein